MLITVIQLLLVNHLTAQTPATSLSTFNFYSLWSPLAVPLVKATWAKDAEQVVFFSDVEDADIPTVTVGVSNVKRGHCAKTMAILKHVLSNGLLDTRTRWLVVADDDTLLRRDVCLLFLISGNSGHSRGRF